MNLIDEGCSDLGLKLADVRGPEEKLAVQIGRVNCVHIDDVDVHKSHHREILHDFAAEAAGADHQHFDIFHHLLLCFQKFGRIKFGEIGRVAKGTTSS